MSRLSVALFLCFVSAAVSFSPSSLTFRADIRSTRAPSLCGLRATTAAEPSIAPSSKSGWLAKVQRPITKAEIGAIQRQTGSLAGEELKTWLAVRGYKGELLEEVAKQAAQPAESSGEKWEKMLEEAAGLEAKLAVGVKKKADLEAQVKELEGRVAGELTDKVNAAKSKLDEATAEFEQWNWLPVVGGAKEQEKEAAHKAYGAAIAARDTAEGEAKEAQAGVEVLAASLTAEEAQVASLKGEAFQMRLSLEAAAAAALLSDARKVVEDAERALSSGGPAKALATLADGSDALQALGLRPNRNIGASSLPGRLAAVLASAEQAASPASKGASSSSSAAASDSDSGPLPAIIGGVLVAAAAIAAFVTSSPPPAPTTPAATSSVAAPAPAPATPAQQ